MSPLFRISSTHLSFCTKPEFVNNLLWIRVARDGQRRQCSPLGHDVCGRALKHVCPQSLWLACFCSLEFSTPQIPHSFMWRPLRQHSSRIQTVLRFFFFPQTKLLPQAFSGCKVSVKRWHFSPSSCVGSPMHLFLKPDDVALSLTSLRLQLQYNYQKIRIHVILNRSDTALS